MKLLDYLPIYLPKIKIKNTNSNKKKKKKKILIKTEKKK